MADPKDIVIVGAARTATGAFLGSLAKIPAPVLGAAAIKAAVERAGIKPEDVDEVISILKELGQEMQADSNYGPDILEPIEILGLDRFDDSAIVIRARFKTKPVRQWAIGREFNRRMKKRFDERGIEIPFPHQTVYIGEPKEGTVFVDTVAFNAKNAHKYYEPDKVLVDTVQ